MNTNSQNSRKRNYCLVIAALLIISVLNFSCSKPENGKDGKDGAPGTANVFNSDWLPATFPNAVGLKAMQIDAPKITQEIVDKGTVLVYLKLSTGEIIAANTTQITSASSVNNVYLFRVGIITVFSDYPSTTIISVRYIIIPAGV